MHALKTNFEDLGTTPSGPEIQKMLLDAPKYGNDDDYVDDIMNKQREIIYGQRRNVLDGADLQKEIGGFISNIISNAVHTAFGERKAISAGEYQTLLRSLEGSFFPKYAVQLSPEEASKSTPEQLSDVLDRKSVV